MATSVLEAIRMGLWDYEPEDQASKQFPETAALPGSDDKLAILAKRLELGLPLWHPKDRRDCEGLYDEARQA